MCVSQEELNKEFYDTTLPARLEKFDGLLKGPFFMGEKVNIRLCSAKLLTMSVAYNFTLSTCNAGWGGGGGEV